MSSPSEEPGEGSAQLTQSEGMALATWTISLGSCLAHSFPIFISENFKCVWKERGAEFTDLSTPITPQCWPRLTLLCP